MNMNKMVIHLCLQMLIFVQGTPMMLMGDEYGHTRNGNNNSYGHDTSINHFQWKQVPGLF